MTRRKKVPAVTSFGPELLSLLLAGSTERREVELDSPQAAFKLRHRIHILRSAMRTENHRDKDLVEKAKVSVVGNRVIVQPQDSEFANAIKASGLQPPQLEVDPLEEFKPQTKK